MFSSTFDLIYSHDAFSMLFIVNNIFKLFLDLFIDFLPFFHIVLLHSYYPNCTARLIKCCKLIKQLHSNPSIYLLIQVDAFHTFSSYNLYNYWIMQLIFTVLDTLFFTLAGVHIVPHIVSSSDSCYLKGNHTIHNSPSPKFCQWHFNFIT